MSDEKCYVIDGDGRFALCDGYEVNETYVITSLFAYGGSSLVYRAKNVVQGKEVLIKECYPSRDKNTRKILLRNATTGELVIEYTEKDNTDAINKHFELCKQRMYSEIEILHSLAGAEGGFNSYTIFSEVLDKFEFNNTVYVVYPFRNYETLQNKPMDSLKMVLQHTQMLLHSLRPLHRAGYLHLDLSVDNLLDTRLGNPESPVIAPIDFNSAHSLVNLRKTNAKITVSHKEGFSAPELEELHVDPTKIGSYTDLYSVAATAYFWLHGRELSYQKRNSGNVEMRNDLPIIGDASPALIRLCNSILKKGLNNAAAKRFQSVDAFNIAVNEALEEADKKVYLRGNNPAPTPHFTGRANDISKIKCVLDSSPWVDIVGIGGIGKTEVARSFAQSSIASGKYHTVHLERYNGSFESLLRGLNFANDEKIPAIDLAEHNYNLLNDASEGILLIVDNFDSDITLRATDSAEAVKLKEREQDWRERLKKLNKTKVIFTTRNSIDGNRDNPSNNQVFLSEFCKEDALSLFSKHCGEASSYNIEVINLLDKIFYHTLVIILTARFLSKKKTLNAEVINTLANELAISPAEIGSNEESSLSMIELRKDDRIWELLAITHVERLFNLNDLNSSAQYALTNMSLLSLSGLPFDSFCERAEADAVCLEQLIDTGWVMVDSDNVFLHPIVSNVANVKLKPTYEKCLKLLSNISTEISEYKDFYISPEDVEKASWLCDFIRSSFAKLLDNDPDSTFYQVDFFGGGMFLLSRCGMRHDDLVLWAKYEAVSGESFGYADDFEKVQSEFMKFTVELQEKYGDITELDKFSASEIEDIVGKLRELINAFLNVNVGSFNYPQQSMLFDMVGICYGQLANFGAESYETAIKYYKESLNALSDNVQSEGDYFQIATMHGKIGESYMRLYTMNESNVSYRDNTKFHLDEMGRFFDEKPMAHMAGAKFMQIVFNDNIPEFRKTNEEAVNELQLFVDNLERIGHSDYYMGMAYGCLSAAYKKIGNTELSIIYAEKKEEFEKSRGYSYFG